MIKVDPEFFDIIRNSHQITSLMVFYAWDEQPSFSIKDYDKLRDFEPDMNTPMNPKQYDRVKTNYADYDAIRHYIEGDGSLVTTGVVGKAVNGSVTADRSARARRTFSASVALHGWEDVPVDIVSSRVQIWTGVFWGSMEYMIPVGVFRVDSIGRVNAGVLSLEGASLEQYVIDNSWAQAGEIPAGTSIIAKIVEIINDSVPGDVFYDITTEARSRDKPLPYPTPYEIGDSKWDMVESLAFDINCDVYCDPTGKFRIAPRPDLGSAVPAASIHEGPDGVLVTLNTQVSRDKTYNGWVAMGESSGDIPPYSALVTHTDPDSLMRWGGPFGKRLGVYKSKMLTSKELCTAKAEELLKESLALSRKLDFGAIPNPALEPDDVVRVSMLDGTYEDHMITKMTIPLGLGDWTAETLSNKDRNSVINPDRPIEVPTPDTSQLGTFWRSPGAGAADAITVSSPSQHEVCWVFQPPANPNRTEQIARLGWDEEVLHAGTVVVSGEVSTDTGIQLLLDIVHAAPGEFADFFQPGATVTGGLRLSVSAQPGVWQRFTVSQTLSASGIKRLSLAVLVPGASSGNVCVRRVRAEVRP